MTLLTQTAALCAHAHQASRALGLAGLPAGTGASGTDRARRLRATSASFKKRYRMGDTQGIWKDETQKLYFINMENIMTNSLGHLLTRFCTNLTEKFASFYNSMKFSSKMGFKFRLGNGLQHHLVRSSQS